MWQGVTTLAVQPIVILGCVSTHIGVG